MEKPKSKAQAFKEYRKKHGRYHPADPTSPMNAEGISKLEEIKTPNKSLARRKKGGILGGPAHNRLY